MKNLIKLVLFVLFFLPSYSLSQVTISIFLPPPGTPNFIEKWELTITNSSQNTYKTSLKFTVDEETTGRILDGEGWGLRFYDVEYSVIPPGIRKYKYPDFKNAVVNFTNEKFKDVYKKTGTVPSGKYQICTFLYSENNEQLATDCKSYTVANITPPSMISPRENVVIENYPFTFQWTPPSPIPQGINLNYELKVCEILEGQSKIEAIKSNPPLIYKKGLTQTSYTTTNMDILKLKNILRAVVILCIDEKMGPYGHTTYWLETEVIEFRTRPDTLPTTEPCYSSAVISGTGGISSVTLSRSGINNIGYAPTTTYTFNGTRSHCITISGMYYSWKIINVTLGTEIVNGHGGPSHSISFTFGPSPALIPGNTYKLCVNSNCGGKSCEDCFQFVLVPICTCDTRWTSQLHLSYLDNFGNLIENNFNCGTVAIGPILVGSTVNISGIGITCLSGCLPDYETIFTPIVTSSPVTVTPTGFSFNFLPASLGVYHLKIKSKCGDTYCDTCGIYFYTAQRENICRCYLWETMNIIYGSTSFAGINCDSPPLNAVYNEGTALEILTIPTLSCVPDPTPCDDGRLIDWDVYQGSVLIIDDGTISSTAPFFSFIPTSAGDYRFVLHGLCGFTDCYCIVNIKLVQPGH